VECVFGGVIIYCLLFLLLCLLFLVELFS